MIIYEIAGKKYIYLNAPTTTGLFEIVRVNPLTGLPEASISEDRPHVQLPKNKKTKAPPRQSTAKRIGGSHVHCKTCGADTHFAKTCPNGTPASAPHSGKLSFEEFRAEVKTLADEGMLPSAVATKLKVRLKMVAKVWPKAWPKASEQEHEDDDGEV